MGLWCAVSRILNPSTGWRFIHELHSSVALITVPTVRRLGGTHQATLEVVTKRNISVSLIQIPWPYRPLIRLGVHKFSKTSRSYLKSVGARKVTWSKFLAEDPQVWGHTVQNVVARATWRLQFFHPWVGDCMAWVNSASYLDHITHKWRKEDESLSFHQHITSASPATFSSFCHLRTQPLRVMYSRSGASRYEE
jgi:hypothetical protein